jgi:hypothetical protein
LAALRLTPAAFLRVVLDFFRGAAFLALGALRVLDFDLAFDLALGLDFALAFAFFFAGALRAVLDVLAFVIRLLLDALLAVAVFLDVDAFFFVVVCFRFATLFFWVFFADFFGAFFGDFFKDFFGDDFCAVLLAALRFARAMLVLLELLSTGVGRQTNGTTIGTDGLIICQLDEISSKNGPPTCRVWRV